MLSVSAVASPSEERIIIDSLIRPEGLRYVVKFSVRVRLSGMTQEPEAFTIADNVCPFSGVTYTIAPSAGDPDGSVTWPYAGSKFVPVPVSVKAVRVSYGAPLFRNVLVPDK